MSDSIQNDDVKFRELVSKQHNTFDSFVDSIPKTEDVIEQDDNKIDDLLILQSLSEDDEVKYDSIEEKYEEHILIDEINRSINEDIIWADEVAGFDPFSRFFPEEEDIE